jgi:carbon-monoxide dehydrogenase large subunit
LAHQILYVPESRIRVVARDVGGGFGMKSNVYPEEAILAWAARRVGRPVKWIPSRSEALLGDYNGRDQTITMAALALDREGRFLALRWTGMHNIGAYIEGAGVVPIIFSLKLASTVYDIPAVSVISRLVFTNTAPTVPYRGSGRPEAVYLMERLVDQAAREMRIDPAEIRRKNLIRAEALPYQTRTGWNYDTGNYAAALAKCQTLADWDGYAARRAQSEAAGKYRGRGISCYIDNTGIFNERMELRFDPSGEVTIVAGTLSHGQGHETSYAQMVADWLGVPEEDPSGAGRHRRGRDRPRHLCFAQHDDWRQRVARRGRRGHRTRQALCGAFHGGRCGRYRLCRWRLHDRRHRPVDADRASGPDVVYSGRTAVRTRRRLARCRRILVKCANFPQWLPYL